MKSADAHVVAGASIPASAALPADKTVRWSAAASQDLIFRASDAFYVPVSLLVCGIMLSSIFSGRMQTGADDPFRIVPTLFAVWAAYLSFGRFIIDILVRTSTVYVVTDRASYIVQPRFVGGTRRFGPAEALQATLQLGAYGIGTIRFKPDWTWSRSPNFVPSARAFERIANAADVYRLVMETVAPPG